MTKESGAIPFPPREVCMVEGGWLGRGLQLVECSLDQAHYAAGDFVARYEESIRTAVRAFGADGTLAGAIRLRRAR